jgi:hypothetical protein
MTARKVLRHLAGRTDGRLVSRNVELCITNTACHSVAVVIRYGASALHRLTEAQALSAWRFTSWVSSLSRSSVLSALFSDPVNC